MSNITYWLLLLAVFIVIKFLLNISKYLYLKKVINKHNIFIDGELSEDEVKKKEGIKAGDWIQENQMEIKNIVAKTGVPDQKRSYMKTLGLGYAQQQNISALDNMLYLNSDILELARETINRAKGYYKIQALKSFNPLYWVESLIFLPREILKYFGVNEKDKFGSFVTKIVQIIYWIASLIFMYAQYKSGKF